MPRARKWAVEHLNRRKSTDRLAPLRAPGFSPEEIRVKRAELAAEMVALLLHDDELGGKPRRELEAIYSSLRQFRRQL